MAAEAQRCGAGGNRRGVSRVILRKLYVGEIDLVEVALCLGGEDQRAQLALGIALAVVALGRGHLHVALGKPARVAAIETVDISRAVDRLHLDAEQ